MHQFITLLRQPPHIELAIGFSAGHTCGPAGGGEAAVVVSIWSEILCRVSERRFSI
jgi:hypothetical protein